MTLTVNQKLTEYTFALRKQKNIAFSTALGRSTIRGHWPTLQQCTPTHCSTVPHALYV